MEPGIYSLLLKLDGRKELEVGSLGIIEFEEGYYSYTGSARGPGGLMRVERHREVMRGQNLARRWHIDYLLPHISIIDAIITRTAVDRECEIAGMIGSKFKAIRHFGSTDCKCPGHLHYSPDLDRLRDVVCKAHALSWAQGKPGFSKGPTGLVYQE
jgi:Uri superfamily endonuclease